MATEIRKDIWKEITFGNLLTMLQGRTVTKSEFQDNAQVYTLSNKQRVAVKSDYVVTTSGVTAKPPRYYVIKVMIT